MAKLVKARKCRCIVCGRRADVFWPVVDPDMPSNPYCRRCLDRAKGELLRRLLTEIN